MFQERFCGSIVAFLPRFTAQPSSQRKREEAFDATKAVVITVKGEYLNKLHSEILTIMDEIDRICTLHGLKYYLIGGTLLGAVRHQGFIPWDDDLDIIMPRKDFEIFISIADSELKQQYKLAWITTNREYRHLYAKVENINTIFFENTKYSSGYPGIFVDIFPIDTTQGYSSSLEHRKRAIRKIATMMGMKVSNEDYGWLKGFILKLFPSRFLNSLATYIMKKSNKRDGEWYTNFGSQYSVKKQTIRKEFYGKGSKIIFEDRMYNAPSNPHEILKSIFGVKYMEIPPEEKQRTHLPQYVKFSNGEELRFEAKKELYKGDFE